MTTKLFQVQEIGSLAKPKWRTEGLRRQLSDKELGEAEAWGGKLAIGDYHDRVKAILKERDPEERSRLVLQLSTLYGLRLFEKAGLDNIGVGGEQQRVEMYEHVIKAVSGMKFLGHVQSFDYKYFRKAVAEGKVRRQHPIYLQEFGDVKEYSHQHFLKVPITGPYTLVDWSFNEYYTRKNKSSNLKERKQEARRDFLLDIVNNVIRPEIRDLVNAGAKWIQIDEPAITTHPEPFDMELFVEAWNETVRGFNVKFSDHTCYPSEIGYQVLADYAPKLDKCSQLALEFANRDSARLGEDPKDRIGYDSIRDFVQEGFNGEFGIGVSHVHDFSGEPQPGSGSVVGRDIIESPELIHDRIVYATKLVGDPAKIWVNPDCGLRTRTWDIVNAKLSSIVKGAELAREEYA